MAFLCPVQDSDDAVPLGALLFSGKFSDCNRTYEEIVSALTKLRKGPYSFGCRIKKQLELTVDRPSNWTMEANQMIHIECDRAHAKDLKTQLYCLFNKTDDRYKRPGGYNY